MTYTMHRILLFAAYGWLAGSGTLHFIIDVVSQYLSRRRSPGAETTLFYGLNSSFALGQVTFGLLCLWLAWTAPALLDRFPMMALSLAAAIGWIAITFTVMGYWEPKVMSGIYAVLLIAAIVVR